MSRYVTYPNTCDGNVDGQHGMPHESTATREQEYREVHKQTRDVKAAAAREEQRDADVHARHEQLKRCAKRRRDARGRM